MAIELTTRTLRALNELSIEPNLIVRIDGYSTLFSAQAVKEFLTYGYDDVRYGDPGLFYGGLVETEDQKQYIDSKSTTFTIRQQMSYDDEAGGSSVSSMTIGLVDKNQEITKLISPGFELDDILGRKVEVFQSFGDTDFFEDSVLVFRGFVVRIDSFPGIIRLKLNHPDNKKQVKLFKSVETQSVNALNSSVTTIAVTNASNFLLPQGALTSYIRIDDELIQYDTIVGDSFIGVTRGALGTLAAPHDADAQVRAMYCLEGNPFDLALQLMMSGFGTDPVHEDIPVSSFVKVGAGSTSVPNAIYFDQINLPQEFGITPGDIVTTTGAINGANNITTRQVQSVTQFDSGYYIVVDGAPLVYEAGSTAVMDHFTQFNALPDGMRMKPEEVDIVEHLNLRNLFFSSTEYRLYIKEDEVDGKEFLDKQIYRPIACYSLPRKSQASVGYTVGPIPGQQIKTLNISSIKNGNQLSLSRSVNRAFFNEVFYKYDDTPLSAEERFLSGNIIISEESKNRIPGRSKTYEVNALGLKTDLNAQNLVAINGQRIIDRYKFGAEVVKCKALLRDSVAMEIGDIVILELDQLKVSDTLQGNRDFQPRLYEIQNKSINLKTGDVDFTLLDTGRNIDLRYGLMSPTSVIAGVVSNSIFVIGPDPFYPAQFGTDEFRKWLDIISVTNPISIRIHNADYSVDEDAVVQNIAGNQFTLTAPVSITLTPGLVVKFTGYVDDDTSDKQKLVYAYMTDDPAFPDTGEPYAML